jgi:hypothetical protein
MSKSSPPLAFVWSAPPVRAHGLHPALRERIEVLARRLRDAHDAYEQAARSWTQDAADKKRGARKVREDTLRELENLLAREGDGERLASLQRLPFAAKLVELEAWVGGEPGPPEAPPGASEGSEATTLEMPTAEVPQESPAEPHAMFATSVEGSESTPSTVRKDLGLADGPTADSQVSEPMAASDATVLASGIVPVSATTEPYPADSASLEPECAPVAATEVTVPNLPILPAVVYGRRRSVLRSMTTSPFGVGVALIVLALAIVVAWQAAR